MYVMLCKSSSRSPLGMVHSVNQINNYYSTAHTCGESGLLVKYLTYHYDLKNISL